MKIPHLFRFIAPDAAPLDAILALAVLFGLGGTITAGVHSYRDTVARSQCVQNIASVQEAVRGFQAENQLQAGDELSKLVLVGDGKLFESEPCCPKSGLAYAWRQRIPLPGRIVVECPHRKDLGHVSFSR